METNRSSDIDGLGDILVRMHKNKCRFHGDSYGEAADLEGKAQMGDIELRAKLLKAYVRKRFCIEGSESEESEGEPEDELVAFD